MPDSKKSSHPLRDESVSRRPGHTLEQDANDQRGSLAAYVITFGTLTIVLVALEWARWYFDVKPHPFLVTSMGIVAFVTMYFVFKKERAVYRKLRLGFDGERYVGQFLEETFRKQGYEVIHDLDTGRGNVDHILIGDKGVFTVETKMRSRDDSGRTVPVSYRNGRLLVNGFDNSETLTQATAQAATVHELLRAGGGECPWVRPIVIFPGCDNANLQSSGQNVWVLSDRGIRSFLKNEPRKLDPMQIQSFAQILRSRTAVPVVE